jgi:hypothetical protein
MIGYNVSNECDLGLCSHNGSTQKSQMILQDTNSIFEKPFKITCTTIQIESYYSDSSLACSEKAVLLS